MYSIFCNGKVCWVGTHYKRVSHYMNYSAAKSYCEALNKGIIEPQYNEKEEGCLVS